jgi:hypothetical protein
VSSTFDVVDKLARRLTPPTAASPLTPHTERPPSSSEELPQNLDIQVKLYSIQSSSGSARTPAQPLTYRVNYWLVPYTSASSPTGSLLPQNCVGSAAVVFLSRSGSRFGFERLIDADFQLKYFSPNTPRLVVVLKKEDQTSPSKNKNNNKGLKTPRDIVDAHRDDVVDEEVSRLAKDRNMQYLEITVPSSSPPSSSESSDLILDTVFERLLSLLQIDEKSVFRDPAFLLQTNIGLGDDLLLKNADFLGALFNSPS